MPAGPAGRPQPAGRGDGVTGTACNEHGGNDLHDGGAVHVDGHAQRQDEGRNALIHAEPLPRTP